MAIYHCSVKVLGKSGGRSAVQFGAYMSGERDFNERTLETYDHTTKEEVAFSEMYFSDDVPEELQDRSKFWNALEKNETSANARFSRTWELALDKDLTLEQMREQVERFKDSLMQDGYSAVQVAIHLKEGNPHAHIMAPCRQMEHGQWQKDKEVKGYLCRHILSGEEQAFKSVKDIPELYERIPLLDANGQQKTDSRNRLQWQRVTISADTLNSRQMLLDQRERWANIQNDYLSPDMQVSHLSYKAQGIDKQATKHLGWKASQLESQGIHTEIGDYNRAVKYQNNHPKTIIEIQEKISLKERLIEQLQEYIQEISRSVSYAADRLRNLIKSSERTDGTTLARESRIEADSSISERAHRDLERERLRIAEIKRTERLKREELKRAEELAKAELEQVAKVAKPSIDISR